MPIIPTILGSNAAPARNDSEYSHVEIKWKSKPDWLQEIEGIRERFGHTDSQTSRQYKCPWSQRFVAQEWLLGYSRTEGDANAADPLWAIRRVPPAQDPSRPWMFASECELVEGRGAWVEDPAAYVRGADGNPLFDNNNAPRRTGAIAYVDNNRMGVAGTNPPVAGFGDLGDPVDPSYTYDDGVAILRVTFRPRNYSILSDESRGNANDAAARPFNSELVRWVERAQDYGLEGIPMSKWGANLKFAEGPAGVVSANVQEAGVKQNPITTLHYIWHEVPDPPHDAYLATVGRVNNAPFDGCNGAPLYAEETLICQPWKLDRKCGPSGRVTWVIHYRLQHRPQGWNKFPAANGNFYFATFGGFAGGEKVYKSADFGKLFIPGAPIRYVG